MGLSSPHGKREGGEATGNGRKTQLAHKAGILGLQPLWLFTVKTVLSWIPVPRLQPNPQHIHSLLPAWGF